MTAFTQSGARPAALGVLLVLLSGASVSAYAPSEPGAGLLEGESDGGHSRSRRLLVTPVLQELLNGANGRYVSANDEMFRVMRRNKQDIELAARGDPQVVEVLRSSTDVITNWVLDPIRPGTYPNIAALVAFAFDGADGCANAGIAWAVGNEFINGLPRSVPVVAQALLLPDLATHINITTTVHSVSSDPALDILDFVPEITETLAALVPAVTPGASIVVVSHPDQAVRAVKLMQAAGFTAYPVDYLAAPWASYGCDQQGYGYQVTGRNATTATAHKLTRAAYLEYEILTRFQQKLAGLVDFSGP